MDKIDAQYRSVPIDVIKGVGQSYADKLHALGLNSLYDLLINLPFRYLDKTKVQTAAELAEHADPDAPKCLVSVVVTGTSFRGQHGRILVIRAQDDTGVIEFQFFNYHAKFAMAFKPGQHLAAFGAPKYNEYSRCMTMSHPELTFLKPGEKIATEKTLSPIYHLTEKLPQKIMGRIEQEALGIMTSQPLTELIPAELLPANLRCTLTEALLTCHYPAPCEDGSLPLPHELPQFERIALEEITAYLAAMRAVKARQQIKNAEPIYCSESLQKEFLATLPYKPTGAQLRVMEEIAEDMNSPHPMVRLVNGDVGSGKTLVAVMTALHAVKAGRQAVLLAPTEILAHQHYEKCAALLAPFEVQCAFLSSRLNAAERRRIYAQIADGTLQFIIGTHAVFQDKVVYEDLALVIIDEQHRFGTRERQAILNKGPQDYTPHLLSLSATPIPRTLQLALYSDLAVSQLDEMPPGRSPIITAVISRSAKDKAIARLNANLSSGVQAYWVCPLIEDSEELETTSVKEIYTELTERLPQCRIGFIHGQMSEEKKNQVMEDFASGKIQLLIATTVIEVGVDVPNATIMVIDNAERMGLAQLHQLRGRVGRGQKQSYCLLIYDEHKVTDLAAQRLQIIRTTTDGFAIAAQDLSLRGPGDVVGTKQAGFDIFRLADPARDLHLTEDARRIAAAITQDHPDLAADLIARWFPQYLDQEDQGS